MRIIVPLFMVFLSAVSSQADNQVTLRPATVDEVYFTSLHLEEVVDSPAVWRGPDNQDLLITTCKETHNLRVEHALNGAAIKRFGGQGSLHGQFNRPNGIAVIDDLLLVVERDNQRVQVFSLPTFTTLTTFGANELVAPYGLYIRKEAAGHYTVYVTDSFRSTGDDDLSGRIKVYTLEVEGTAPQTAEAELECTFGETRGEGRLQMVESLYGDPHYNRLLIAEEDMSEGKQCVKVYSLDGKFSGKNIGMGFFRGQPEGIALFKTSDEDGYWILTDQGKQENYFHLLDRKTLEYAGSFMGPNTLNTDGIWLDPKPYGDRYPRGLFFALNNDGSVAAFDWAEVLKALGVECPPPECGG